MGTSLVFAGPRTIDFEHHDDPELDANQVRILTLFCEAFTLLNTEPQQVVQVVLQFA